MTLTPLKFVVLLALAIRLWGIKADLPNVYHPDEPHHLNVAARFGSGDLNPHDFKYPTLWPYLIAGVFGGLYASFRLFHMVSSSQDFAVLYLTSPTVFYLSVRLMACLLIIGAIVFLYRTAEKNNVGRLPVMVGLFASFTPVLIEYAGETTPYALMLLCLSAAIYYLDDLTRDAPKRSYMLGGLAIGFAASSHYTAAVFGAWLLALHFLRPRSKRNDSYLIYGVVACALGFFIGTPFALIDGNVFFSSLIGLKNSQSTEIWNQPSFSWHRLGQILFKLFFFLDRACIGFMLAVIGFAVLPRAKKVEYLAWFAPLFVLLPFLSFSTFGASTRYLMGTFLILLFLGARGFVWLWDKRLKPIRIGLIFVVFIPLIFFTYQNKREKTLPDTRTMARDWVLNNVPAGSKLFLSDPFYCPQFDRALPQVERLLAKTEALNNPRKEYFRILMNSHPKQGYEIYFLRRTIQEIWDIPERVEPAYQGQEWFDMERSTLADLQRAGIRYLIIDEHAAENRSDSPWLKELRSAKTLAETFSPMRGRFKGPRLEIYDLNSRAASGRSVPKV